MNIIEVSKKENLGKKYKITIDDENIGIWEFKETYRTNEFEFYRNGSSLSGSYYTSLIARMEFAEVIDWSKVKTDTQVLVSDDCENWVNRHFAKYDKEKNKFYTWKDGKTSFTTDLKEEWEYWDMID